MSVLAEIYKRLFALKDHKHTSISDIEDFNHEHEKADITDFAHQHKKQDITDFTHRHTKQDITDFTHQHVKEDITNFGHEHDADEVNVAVSDEVHKAATVQDHIEEIYRQTEELYQKKVSSVNGFTGNVVISDISGNAGTATKLSTKRQIALTGDVSGSAMFDGSSAIDINTTVANDSHTHTKSNITDFAHTHKKADITDFNHTHTKSQISDFAHTHAKSEISDFAHKHTVADITNFPSVIGFPDYANAVSVSVPKPTYSNSSYEGVTFKDYRSTVKAPYNCWCCIRNKLPNFENENNGVRVYVDGTLIGALGGYENSHGIHAMFPVKKDSVIILSWYHEAGAEHDMAMKWIPMM